MDAFYDFYGEKVSTLNIETIFGQLMPPKWMPFAEKMVNNSQHWNLSCCIMTPNMDALFRTSSHHWTILWHRKNVQKWTPFLLQHGASQVDAFDDKELLNIENVFHRKPMLYSSK